MPALKPSEVRSVAALWLGRVGDLIVSTPFLRALRRAYPGARIVLVTSRAAAETAKLIPSVDATVLHTQFFHPLPTMRVAAALLGRRYDILVDLNPAFSKSSATMVLLARARVKLGFKKGRLDAVYSRQVAAGPHDEHMIDRYARLAAELGAPYDGAVELAIPPAADAEAARLLAGLGLPERRPVVLVHPGNFKKYDHRWPEEKFAALTDRLLKEQDVDVLYLAGPGEEARVRAIAARLSRPVPVLANAPIGVTGAVLRRMALCVLNVTGTMHLAAAVGAPTFGFYSGYAERLWKPRGHRHTGLVSPRWGSCREIPVDEACAAIAERIRASPDCPAR